MTKFAKIDSFDRRLLDIVRRDNLQPARLMAETAGLSESAVLRRLRRLRETGIIAADVALVDTARLAAVLTIQVLVQMKRAGSTVMKDFAARAAARPEVVSAWEVAGEIDFLLTLQVPTMTAYETFIDEMLTDDQQVLYFQTLIGLREIVAYDPARQPLPE